MPQLYSTYFEGHLAGYWELDVEGNGILISSQLKSGLGYTVDEFKNSFTTWKQLVFHKDLYPLYKGFILHIKSSGEVPFAQQVQLKHKNGDLVCFMITGKVIQWNDKHKPLKMIGNYMNLSYQREIEKELTRIKNLLDKTSQLGVVGGWEVDLITKKIKWTKTTYKIFELPENYVPDEVLATSYFKHGIDKKIFKQALNDAIKYGTSFDLEQAIITAKGNDIWTRSIGQPEFEDGVCIRVSGISKDITEQKRNEAALWQKQDQLNILLTYSPAAVAMLDKELRYMAVSEAWKTDYNLGGLSIIGQKHYETFPGIPERWKRLYQRCLRGEGFKCEVDNFIKPNGETEWLQWEIRPWYNSIGEVGGIILLTNVITKLQVTEQSLINAQKEVQYATKAKSKFLSIMGHELRTPLNAVIRFTNLLLKNPRKDQLENMSILKFSANNLLVTIDGLLDFHRIEGGGIAFEELDFDINLLLNNIIVIHQFDENAKQIDFELIADPKLPQFIKGDQVRLGQVINNLVNNAIKFTSVGKVNIIAKLLNERESNVDIHFEVNDTGVGIPFEKQKAIFEIFSQPNSENAQEYGETGIGLAVTKRLLELMGSTIQVNSKVGVGSSFFFKLTFKKSNNLKRRHKNLLSNKEGHIG